MLATERRPPPDQLRESAMFRLPSVLSRNPIMCRMVPFGSNGA